ncbi:MAG TPA: DUF3293 domain-containing protein, partial [Acidimicrobiales bacterium]|nr:DUF3293 domain-containing protein [Acidimicrobiales bacterium]
MPEPDRGVPVEDRPELWAAMLATEVRLADRRIVPVGPPTTEVPASPDALVVVTAWNPGGRARPAPVNAGADRRLVAELDRRRLAHEPAVGAALDGSWAEP